MKSSWKNCYGATRALCIGAFLAPIVMSAGIARAAVFPILGPEDTAIAIDVDAVVVPPQNNGRYPAAENPPKVIDNLSGTKYLNFGGLGSGFIVTPASPLAVESFQIRTGNDAPGRDPSSWELYGFNGALITTDSGATPAINQTGLAEAWTLIGSGGLSLPGDPAINNDQRGVLGPLVDVNSGGIGFQHYKVIFPTIKTASTGIMQLAEFQLFADDAATLPILAPSNPIIAVDQTPIPGGFSGSSYPAPGETPARAIDQAVDGLGVPTTKYLNFGEERSGLIITNSDGPVKVSTMVITTANDAVARDPTSYELYGTNDPIQSLDNSNGLGGESWTLISSGPLALPGVLPDGGGDDFRRVAGNPVAIDATAHYTSYKLIFPTVKNAAAANSMQISDVQFYGVPEPSSIALVSMAAGFAAVGIRRRRSRKTS